MIAYQNLLNQIPIQYNFFSFLIFTGIVLAIMISIILLFKKTTDNYSNLYLGLNLLFLAFILADFFLSQTGLMKYVLWLNNSTEVLGLLIPVCTYLLILEILSPEKRVFRLSLHFLLPTLYFLTQFPDFFASKAIQLNDYTESFHPHLPYLEVAIPPLSQFAYSVNQYFHHLLICSFLVYAFLSGTTIRDYNQKMKQQFIESANTFHKFNFSIVLLIFLTITSFLAAFLFIRYQSDAGEQYLMLIPLTLIFGLSMLMMSGIPIFNKNWLLEKYHTSGLNISSSAILDKIITYVETEQYYLKKEGSLKDLSAELSLSATYLSQIINRQAQQNFNDFINQYRVEEAKKRLINEAYNHLSIAGIGETVGFKSKSSFYAVFKKHTQLTPAAYIKMTKLENSQK